jgi:RNA polymerase sigma factor (sigma-70 family)
MSNWKHTNGKAASSETASLQLSRAIEHILRNADDATEVVQKAMLAAWRKCPPEWWREEAAEPLHRWLTVTARHLAIDRARRRERHPTQSLDASGAEPRDRRDEEAANLERRERLGAFLNAWMEELRERYPLNYRLLHGHIIEGRQVKELADSEGLSANAASCRIGWAIAWLQARASKLLKDESE